MAPIPTEFYLDDKAAPLGAPAVTPTPKQRSTVRRALRWIVLGAVLLHGALVLCPDVVLRAVSGTRDALAEVLPSTVAEDLCVQADALTPSKHGKLWEDLGFTIETEEFREKAVKWLGGAVQVPTESYDKVRASSLMSEGSALMNVCVDGTAW